MPHRVLKRLAAIALLAAAFAACATTEDYEAMLDGWIGKHADRLVEAWGPPEASYTYTDGRRSLKYVASDTRYYPPITSFDPYTSREVVVFDGLFRKLDCTTTFETDPKGVIRSWKWRGNNCVAEPRHDFSGRGPR